MTVLRWLIEAGLIACWFALVACVALTRTNTSGGNREL